MSWVDIQEEHVAELLNQLNRQMKDLDIRLKYLDAVKLLLSSSLVLSGLTPTILLDDTTGDGAGTLLRTDGSNGQQLIIVLDPDGVSAGEFFVFDDAVELLELSQAAGAAFSGNLTTDAGTYTMLETTTPTPRTNYGKIYCKTDNKLYFQDGAGVEHEVALV